MEKFSITTDPRLKILYSQQKLKKKLSLTKSKSHRIKNRQASKFWFIWKTWVRIKINPNIFLKENNESKWRLRSCIASNQLFNTEYWNRSI